MNKNIKRIILILIPLFSIMIIAAPYLYFSNSAFAAKAKGIVKSMISKTFLPPLGNPEKGLENVINVTEFADSKKIYETDKIKRIVNYAEGYYFDIPSDFELTNSTPYMKASSERAQIVASREWAFDSNIEEYISHYLNRFILSPDFQKANKVTVTENTKNGRAQVITAVINDLETSYFNTYTYCIFKSKTQNFYRIMFKYNSEDTEFKNTINKTIKTFKYFSPSGKLDAQTSYYPVVPYEWSDETNAVYENINNSKQLTWGIFSKDIYDEGINETIPELEKKLDYKFSVILSYLHFGTKFPTEFMQKNYNENRLVELTYQTTTSNNEELFGYTPFLDIYRGKKDDEIRSFAKAAKEFGHPFLFRLNNEANSDWTSYSGVVNMSDPDIYVENWRRFYRIFKEEGVNNAIWIFNPNDRNYPPCNWNDFTSFYPGNEYVHMIGVTGYNNGTYYDNEKWREFDEIYDAIEESYLPMFEKFPWIITEFSSSSVGGNKAVWITNMFKNLHKYPQIKIAVWFSYADYDVNQGREHIPARPYWLDETDETLKAFKDGVKSLKSNSLFSHR